MLIGIVGFIGSGKGTVGDYLVDSYNFKQDSFARSLKDGVATVFGWDREMLEGITPESRSWREKPDEYWSEVCGFELSPRYALQLYGTECMRHVFTDAIWAATVVKRYNEAGKIDTVITDCRFENEFYEIKSTGGYVIQVKRGPNPAWYNQYYDLKKEGNWYEIGKLREDGTFPHVSETDWIGLEFDSVLLNDGTLNELYFEIGEFINGIG